MLTDCIDFALLKHILSSRGVFSNLYQSTMANKIIITAKKDQSEDAVNAALEKLKTQGVTILENYPAGIVIATLEDMGTLEELEKEHSQVVSIREDGVVSIPEKKKPVIVAKP